MDVVDLQSSSGHPLISRAGKFCYIKDKTLQREKEFLDPEGFRRSQRHVRFRFGARTRSQSVRDAKARSRLTIYSRNSKWPRPLLIVRHI